MVNLHILSSIVCFKEATVLSTELFICLKRRGKAALSDMNGEILRASQHTCAGPVSLSISNCRSRRSSYLAGLAFGKSLLFLAQLEQISATSPFNTPGWSKTYSGGQKKKKKVNSFSFQFQKWNSLFTVFWKISSSPILKKCRCAGKVVFGSCE